MTTRRDFIHRACLGCMGLVAGASLSGLLAGCSPIHVLRSEATAGYLDVPKSAFAPEERLKVLRLPTLNHDVLLVLEPDGQHRALLMQCTHADAALVAHAKGLSCNIHGSSFNLKGEVTFGPAVRPLIAFPVVETEGSYQIDFRAI
jgi:nitrite reductase/ring-hydroxylating ferredoxin subunit